MATLVLGVASSHSPQLSTSPDIWHRHAERDQRNPRLFGADGRYHDYTELLSATDPAIAAEVADDVWWSKYDRSQAALARLQQAIIAARPDVVLVVGDDEHELFLDDGIPAFALYLGDAIWDLPPSTAELDALPVGLIEANWARHAAHEDRYLTCPDLACHVAEALSAADFDVHAMHRQPAGRSLGHAFTFVRRRLELEPSVPILPVLLNTYFPPNVPSVRRVHGFGRALRDALDAWSEPLRVVVVASGGLSHFVVNEALDRAVLDALAADDLDAVDVACAGRLESGSSEIRNWIAVSGMLPGTQMDVVDYIPAYRTLAGTGVGLGFALWRPLVDGAQ
jgi:3-O-methylgallate 3,4-dioxygenase